MNTQNTTPGRCKQLNKNQVQCYKGESHTGPCKFKPVTVSAHQAKLLNQLLESGKPETQFGTPLVLSLASNGFATIKKVPKSTLCELNLTEFGKAMLARV